MDAVDKKNTVLKGIKMIEARIYSIAYEVASASDWLNTHDSYHFLYEEMYDGLQVNQEKLQRELKHYREMVNAWCGRFEFVLMTEYLWDLSAFEFEEPHRFRLEDLFYTEDIQQADSDDHGKDSDG